MLIVFIGLSLLELEQALNVTFENIFVFDCLKVHSLALRLTHALYECHALVGWHLLTIRCTIALLKLLHEHSRLVKLSLLLFHLFVYLGSVGVVNLLMLLEHRLCLLLLLEVGGLVELIDELLRRRLQLLALLHHHEVLVLVLHLGRAQELLQVAHFLDAHLF